MDNVAARKNQLRQGTEVLVKSFESLSKTLQEKVRSNLEVWKDAFFWT